MSESEVCPTEDLFMALLDTLVYPYVVVHPDVPQQQLVANQFHAVVLLCNYYHRKRHPSLEYLSLTSCCQLAVIFNPTLLLYMNRLPNYPTDQLKLSSNVDEHHHHPISKLTVFLLDSTRDNCFLLFHSGFWSPIQTHLPSSPTNQDHLLQLAFSRIKDVAGIDITHLHLLETHIASEENTPAHFFILQSSQSITKDHQVHVKDVIQSLQGPLVRKSSRGWMLTTANQYFHLLPYTGILSDWFSREQLSKHLRVNVKDTVMQCSKSTENHWKYEVVVDENTTHENLCVTDAVKNEASNGSHDTTTQEISDGYSHRNFVPEKVDGDEFYKIASSNVKVNHPIQETTAMEIDKDVLPSDIILLENDNGCPDSIIQQDKVDVDTCGSVNINHPITKIDSLETDKYVSPNDINLVDKVDVDTCGSLNINHPITKIDSLEIDKYVSPNDINLVALKTNSMTGITSKQFKVEESKNSRISSDTEDSEALGNHAVDSRQSNSTNVEKPTSNLVLDEDALRRATLKPLLEKREELFIQRSSIEEELALCEKHIQKFINDDAIDMEVKMQVVRDFCNAKRKRSSDAFLPKQHPCQASCMELDIFCCMNNWMLPTYCVRSLHDGFHADVNVKGVDFSLSAGSDLKTTPAEARASAAVKMMALLDRVLPKQ